MYLPVCDLFIFSSFSFYLFSPSLISLVTATNAVFAFLRFWFSLLVHEYVPVNEIMCVYVFTYVEMCAYILNVYAHTSLIYTII